VQRVPAGALKKTFKSEKKRQLNPDYPTVSYCIFINPDLYQSVR
jgi:hypothetical protein